MSGRAADSRKTYLKKEKGGDSRPLFSRENDYRFFVAFFFPPLAAFLAMSRIPPFRIGVVAKSSHRGGGADAFWHPARASALVASL